MSSHDQVILTLDDFTPNPSFHLLRNFFQATSSLSISTTQHLMDIFSDILIHHNPSSLDISLHDIPAHFFHHKTFAQRAVMRFGQETLQQHPIVISYMASDLNFCVWAVKRGALPMHLLASTTYEPLHHYLESQTFMKKVMMIDPHHVYYAKCSLDWNMMMALCKRDGSVGIRRVMSEDFPFDRKPFLLACVKQNGMVIRDLLTGNYYPELGDSQWLDRELIVEALRQNKMALRRFIHWTEEQLLTLRDEPVVVQAVRTLIEKEKRCFLWRPVGMITFRDRLRRVFSIPLMESNAVEVDFYRRYGHLYSFRKSLLPMLGINKE